MTRTARIDDWRRARDGRSRDPSELILEELLLKVLGLYRTPVNQDQYFYPISAFCVSSYYD